MHVIGASGTGKSKFLEHIIRQDIKAGNGLCLLDPHGTLYDKLVNWLAINDFDDFLTIHLFEPTADGWSFGFNPLNYGTAERKEIDYAIDAVTRVFAQVWGGEDQQRTPLLKRCLKLTLFALAKHNLTLLEAREITSSSDTTGLRQLLTADLGDEVFEREWEDMNALNQRLFNEYFSSTNNRFFDFLSAQIITHTIGQQKRVLDVGGIMERGEILLVDLSSRGTQFTEGDSNLIGALLVNDFLLKAQSRPEGSRPFYLYIDECYRYLTDDIRAILFETRKFGLHLVLAHQDLSQLGPPDSEMHNAVMGGAQTKIVFRLGSMRDTQRIAEEFEVDLQEAKRKFKTYQTTGTRIVELGSRSVSEGVSTTEAWSETKGTSDSSTESRSSSKSRGEASGRGIGEQEYSGEGVARYDRTNPIDSLFLGKTLDPPDIQRVQESEGSGRSSSKSSSQSHSSSSGRSTSHSSSRSHSSTYGSSETHSLIVTEGTHEALAPIIEETYIHGYSLEEQRTKIAWHIRQQDDRHALFITPRAEKLAIVVPEVRNLGTDEELEEAIENFKLRAFKRSVFANPTTSVVAEIEARRERLLPPEPRKERENW